MGWTMEHEEAEVEALVDLVDANVSPADHPDEWASEIIARREGHEDAPGDADFDTDLKEMIDRLA